jgi:hypothetical protein
MLKNYTGVGILTNFPFVTGYLNAKSSEITPRGGKSKPSKIK